MYVQRIDNYLSRLVIDRVQSVQISMCKNIDSNGPTKQSQLLMDMRRSRVGANIKTVWAAPSECQNIYGLHNPK